MNLYELKFYHWPNGDYREQFGIGVFSTKEEAEVVKAYYFQNVNGFKDYDCEAEILEVPVVGFIPNLQNVYRFTGWNVNEDYDEIDIIYSSYYVSQQQAQADYEKAKRETPRQEWALNCDVIGKREWIEGFVMIYPDDTIESPLK